MNPRLLLATVSAAAMTAPPRSKVALIDDTISELSERELIELLEMAESTQRTVLEAPKMVFRPEPTTASPRPVYAPRPQTISVRERIQQAETLAALDEILSIASRMQSASNATRTQWLKAAKQRQAELREQA